MLPERDKAYPGRVRLKGPGCRDEKVLDISGAEHVTSRLVARPGGNAKAGPGQSGTDNKGSLGFHPRGLKPRAIQNEIGTRAFHETGDGKKKEAGK